MQGRHAVAKLTFFPARTSTHLHILFEKNSTHVDKIVQERISTRKGQSTRMTLHGGEMYKPSDPGVLVYKLDRGKRELIKKGRENKSSKEGN
jgi:hypothetical protein